jgi:hypothetical protein
VVNTVEEATAMKRKPGEQRSTRVTNTSSVRASISFPPDLYETLESLAKQKKVSVAWVVRDAAEKYITGRVGEGRRQAPE